MFLSIPGILRLMKVGLPSALLLMYANTPEYMSLKHRFSGFLHEQIMHCFFLLEPGNLFMGFGRRLRD